MSYISKNAKIGIVKTFYNSSYEYIGYNIDCE